MDGFRLVSAPTTLLFDQFQRYSIAAAILRSLPVQERPKLIELGANTHSALGRFCTEWDIVYLDREAPADAQLPENFVQGDATSLEFGDSAFDFSVSLDVLEHVPAEKRRAFVAESFRVARRAAVFAFPESAEETSAAERAANAVWEQHTGEDFIWLKEHFENGLPDVNEVLVEAKRLTPYVLTFGHGSLSTWLPMMKLHFLKEFSPELRESVFAADRFYNSELAASDRQGAPYRRFVVLLRTQEDFQQLQNLLAGEDPEASAQGGPAEAFQELVTALAEGAEALTARRVRLERDLASAQEEAAENRRLRSETEDLKCELERELERSRQEGAALQRQNELLQQSRSWRLTAPLRGAGRKARQVRRVQRALSEVVAAQGGLGGALRGAWPYLRSGRVGVLSAKLRRRLQGPHEPSAADGDAYQRWLALYDTAFTDAEELEELLSGLEVRPRFSILMPCYNPDLDWLARAINSVRNQAYPDWELCITDDASDRAEVRKLIQQAAQEDERIRCVFHEVNGHICEATNSALEIATGDWLVLLDNDDELHPEALLWVADAISRSPTARLVYTDEDKLDDRRERQAPYFKCDFNYDLFLSHNMICHLGAYHAATVRDLGGFRKGFEGAQDWDLALRVLDAAGPEAIVHVPRVLYHWRVHSGSTASGASAKNYALAAAVNAVQEHLDRCGVRAVAQKHPFLDYLRVKYAVPEPTPLVSIVVPTRDRVDLLSTCIESVMQKTNYPNLEIIVVDNGTECPRTLSYFEDAQRRWPNVRVLRDDRPFNYSALNNAAVRVAEGDYICLMNNDIEVISPDWLDEMVGHASRSGVGCVGAKLYYPNNLVQHAGVVLGIGGVAGHVHKMIGRDSGGYFGRAQLTQSLSAVTAACLVVKKTVFDEVGGLDEEHLAVAFNDVDFCLRVREAGYRNVFTPFAELYHHESVSRGLEDTAEKRKRFAAEAAYMMHRWKPQLDRDPAYSPNLSLDSEQFAYAFPPRLTREA